MPENLVGKGYFHDDKELDVRILKQYEKVLKEFILEIKTITTLNHKNVISFFGLCFIFFFSFYSYISSKYSTSRV